MFETIEVPLIYPLFLLFIVLGDMVFFEIIRRRYAKKAHYDCSQCRAWDCPVKVCAEKRKNGDVRV